MPASRARKARRAMKAKGVEVVERIILPKPPVTVSQRDRVDILCWEAARSIKALVLSGADLDGTISVTIGEHPSYPGEVTIEAKASKRRPEAPTEIALAPMSEADLLEFRTTLGLVEDDDGLDPDYDRG